MLSKLLGQGRLRSTNRSAIAATLFAVVISPLLVAQSAIARELTTIVVASAFVELRMFPGSGYPVRDVVERGESLVLLKQRTTWIKVRTASGKEGWVAEGQLQNSLTTAGAPR